MANNVTVQLDPFKKGDTPTFRFTYSNPYSGFDWSGVTVDAAMTAVQAPTDNTGAVATRLSQTLVTVSDGAYFEFTLTPTESRATVVGATYNVEAQLKQGGTSVSTPATAKVKVLQDYVV